MRTAKRQFTLEYWQDDGWLVGRLVEVPGVFSQGKTLTALQENIQDAYSMMIETDTVLLTPSMAKRKAVTLRVA